MTTYYLPVFFNGSLSSGCVPCQIDLSLRLAFAQSLSSLLQVWFEELLKFLLLGLELGNSRVWVLFDELLCLFHLHVDHRHLNLVHLIFDALDGCTQLSDVALVII